MKNKLNELRLDAGIARIENQKWLCVLDKETGMMVDPLIGLEKFAELIVTHCASLCMAKADRKNILNAYNLLTEGDVQYPAPDPQGHHSQYEREYNLP